MITGMTYLDMLQLWWKLQLQNILTLIFQQHGSPTHFHCEVHQYLNTVLPESWIGHASVNDQQLMLWPLRFPDIMPCDFFFGDMSKTGYSSHHCHMTSLT
jgi:hypothetical protein